MGRMSARARRWTLAAAGVVTLAVLALASHGDREAAVRAPAESARDAVKADTIALPEAVERLETAAENHAGYDREEFELYQDADGDGCNARYETLIAEAVEGPQVAADCKLSRGEWYSYYDGVTLNDPQDVSIDHMVALSEAWDSGAREWPKEKLVSYGSYLGDPGHLVGVTQKINGDKSDKDIAEWLPPVEAERCRYVGEFVGVKLRWGLTVDEAERKAMKALADGESAECHTARVRVP